MTRELLRETITPAESEASVRTYECTYYHSRLLGLQANGFLSVTNKRVIFQAQGKSSAGLSIIQSEVPIADVSGITSYKGTYFSLGHLIGALAVALIVNALLSPILLLIGGFGDYETLQAIGWILAIVAAAVSFFIPNKMIWRTVLAAVAMGAMSALAGGALTRNFMSSLFSSRGGGGTLEMIFVFVLGLYTLVCIVFYSRRPTFSLSISSKGGSSSPINISGATGLGIFDVAAGKALTAEPAGEAEQMLQELGAVILDIQMLGDFGIAKWSQGGRAPESR